MRYYDLIETPKTGKTFLEGGGNRIPENDKKVNAYFQSIDKVKYDRYFDEDGYPKLHEYELKEDGTRYEIYKDSKENNIYIPDDEKITKLEDSRLKNKKKQQYSKYCNDEIEPYHFTDTVLIDVTSHNLVLLLEKLTGWKSDAAHINWMEDGEWLQLTKVDLQKICTYAEDLKQVKFETIFGFGE